jgi:transcriptional repressor NF-X1
MTDTLAPTPAPQAGPSRTGPPSSRDSQAPPQPGDGAYLRWQQQQNGPQFRGRGRGNGQGQGYMGMQINGRGRGQPKRGGGRGGFPNGHGGQEGGRGVHDGQGHGQDIGQSAPGQAAMRQAPPHQAPHQVKTKPNGPTQGQAHADGLPHRPQQPESMHGLAEAAPHQHSEASRGRKRSGDRGQRGRGRGKGGNGPTGPTPQTLDPGATSFQPLSAPSTPVIGTEPLADDTIRTQSERGKPRPKPKPKAPAQVRSQPKTPDTPAAARTPMGNTRLSRKAAFDQGAKLTKTTSASSSGSTLEDTRKKETKSTHKDKKTAEADDLIDRLTRGLGKKPFFECPICYNAITPSQQIWCCLPPDGPPPSPFAPGIDVIDPKIISTHYQACFTPFHYSCVKDWSVRNYEEDKTRLRMIDSQEEAVWRCPGCQKRRAGRIPPYR